MLHQVAERLVDHAVARDRGLSGERRRDDGEAPVGAAALTVAGVAAVRLALVDQLEALRLQAREPLADALGDAQGLSSAYRESTTPWASTNTSISPRPPNSLKFTQALSEKL